jgi:DDE family transposase
VSTTELNDYLDWPEVGQVFRLTRERTVGQQTTVETACGITSLTREEADAGRLAQLTRGHWGIENGLHWVRDVTLGEDACRVRTGSAPQLLAALRNAILHLLPRAVYPNTAAALRRFAAYPREAVALLAGSPDTG